MPNPKCESCSLVHAPMSSCSEAQAAALAFILEHAGRQEPCPICDVKLWWIERLDGSWGGYTEHGRRHVPGGDCCSKAHADAEARTAPNYPLAIRALLMAIAKIQKCRCGAELYFVRYYKSGKFAPYTAAGGIHFADCPFSDRFKRAPAKVGG